MNGAPIDENGNVIVRCKRGKFRDYVVRCKASSIMRQFFNGPYFSWKQVPDEAKAQMWNTFVDMHTIVPEELHNVHFVWNNHLKRQLTTSLSVARKRKISEVRGDINKARDNPPSWITKVIWNELFDFWASRGIVMI